MTMYNPLAVFPSHFSSSPSAQFTATSRGRPLSHSSGQFGHHAPFVHNNGSGPSGTGRPQGRNNGGGRGPRRNNRGNNQMASAAPSASYQGRDQGRQQAKRPRNKSQNQDQNHNHNHNRNNNRNPTNNRNNNNRVSNKPHRNVQFNRGQNRLGNIPQPNTNKSRIKLVFENGHFYRDVVMVDAPPLYPKKKFKSYKRQIEIVMLGDTEMADANSSSDWETTDII